MCQIRDKVILGSDKLLVYGLTFILDHVFYENCFLDISHYIRKLVFNSFHDKVCISRYNEIYNLYANLSIDFKV